MNTIWLEAFREVAARGSLSAAGESLGYTQPAMSRHIAALENATGARLFDRLSRGVRLTEEGRSLLPYAEAMLERMNAAHEALAALRDLDAGRLRVGAFASADAELVPRALAAFHAAHPQIELSLVEANSSLQLGHLQDGRVDVAVISVYPDQTPDTGHLDLHRLLDDPLMVALAAGHRLGGGHVLRLAELASEHWIEGFPGSVESLIEACARVGFRPRIAFGAREWIAKQGFVAAGLGVALVPLLAARSIRPDIKLSPLDPDDAPVRTIYAATLRGATMAPPAIAFLNCLQEAARTIVAASSAACDGSSACDHLA
ncbi:LysR family transcriptional regulator [Actinomadura barringtoniae]|uniref:LysR family transcriptional regulator n=1 Tax=Actinomadura barringtoniae TaxID=1427535 RepID=A0A939PHW2_9ACTN|nr:LysR family transcriptional regulator [Actinomadura barringtoniae]MBO2450104.1 LysR family transcriptional regulator [Actinomadura barringtoniae]